MWSNKTAAERISAAAARGKHRIPPKRENYWAPKAAQEPEHQKATKSTEMKGYVFDSATMEVNRTYAGFELVNEMRGVSIFKNKIHVITLTSFTACFRYIDTHNSINCAE